MATETITLEVSQDILAALKMGATDLGQQIRLLAAIASVLHEGKMKKTFWV